MKFQSLAVAAEGVGEAQSLTQTMRYMWIVEFGIEMAVAGVAENSAFLAPDDHPFVLKQFKQENLAVKVQRLCCLEIAKIMKANL